MTSQSNKKELRQNKLLSLVEAHGHVGLSEAASTLQVSVQTVRRDALELEKFGRMRRTHGGIAFTGVLDRSAWQQRQRSQTAEKKALARRIAEIVTDGMTIFLDIGTTCEAVAEALLARRNLKIVTYSIRSATLFDTREDFTVAIPGGIVRHLDGAIIGTGGEDFIAQFNFDYAVVAVSGVDMDGRLADDDAFEVFRVRAAMSRANKIILALTSSKVGASGLVRLCGLNEVDMIVTNGRLPHPLETLAEASGVEILLSQPGTRSGA